MEAAGLASSIITFLDLSAKVISRCHEYGAAAKNAPEFLRAIENNLPLLIKSLETLKRQSLNRTVPGEVATELVSIVNNAFIELKRIDQYIRMLKPANRSSSLQKLDNAIKGVFKYDAKIQAAMDKLRGYTDTLSFYQLSVSTGKTEDILRHLKSIKGDQADLLTQQQRVEITQWIAGSPRDDYIDYCIARRAPGTCRWIFDTPAYTEWHSDAGNRISKVLWVHGPPGFGKTFLSATVFSQLEQEARLVAGVFWTADGQFTSSPLDDIPRSWLTQLLSQDVSLVDRLKTIWTVSRSTRASPSEIWESLRIILAASVKPIVLLIDGLDEYQQQQTRRGGLSGLNHELSVRFASIQEFLQKLKTILREVPCQLLLVSQQEGEIRAEFSAVTLSSDSIVGLEHNIVQEDVQQDVEAFASFIVEGKMPKENDALKADLAGSMASKAEGQMLWIAYQRDALRKSSTERKLRSVIEVTPTALDKLYQANFDRILKHLPADDKSKALRILHWIMYAFRPLSVHELVEAVLIDVEEDDSIEFPVDELPRNPDDEDVFGEIKTLCGNFVTFDIDETQKQSRHWKVRFAHSSVRVFLTQKLPSHLYDNVEQDNFRELNTSIIGNLCLRYLSYKEVWPEQQEGAESSALIAPAHPVLTYAATYWPMHLTEKTRSDMKRAMSTFFREHYDTFQRWKNVSLRTKDFVTAGLAQRNLWHWSTRLSFAAALGLEDVVEELCTRGDEVDPVAGSPLWAACSSGSLPCVRILVERGAWIERPLSGAVTPVRKAVSDGRLEIVEYFIKRGVDLNASGPGGNSLLHLAARNGFEEVVKVLLAAGADPLKVNNIGNFPLFECVQSQYPKVVAVLLSTDVQAKLTINHISDFGWTPLSIAAYNGDTEIVRMLLEKGADPLLIGESGKTPLYLSALQGYSDVFMLLFQSCSNVSEAVNKVTESQGVSLLHAAVQGQNLEIIKKLVESGADISRHDNSYQSPIDWAISYGLKDVVDFLLANHANVDLTSSTYTSWTPLMSAAESGLEEMVKMLLDQGASVEVSDEENYTALAIAAEQGHASIVKILLDRDSGRTTLEIKSFDDGCTPLLIACNAGHAEIVTILLNAGADPSAGTDRGTSCLDQAAVSGSLETVQVLLDKCGTSAFPGTLILHCAAESGNKAIFDLLYTHYKLNLETYDSGWTVLHAAAAGGNVDILKIILKEGPEELLMTRDNKEHLSLYQACELGELDAARFLVEKYLQHVPPVKFHVDDVFGSVCGGNVEVVKLLYDSDAQRFKDAKDKGWTPLHIACLHGEEAMVSFLLKKGYKLLDKDDDGESCLHAYARYGHVEVSKFFDHIDWNEGLAARSIHGLTPLLVSCYYGSTGVFRQFVRHGANTEDVTEQPWMYSGLVSKGCLAFHHAVGSGSMEIVKLILETGAKSPRLKSALGLYPIHLAVMNDHDFMVEFLLDKGSSFEVSTMQNETPLFLAVCLSSRLSVAKLLKVGAGAFEKQQALPIMAYAALDESASSMKLLHANGFELRTGQQDGQTLLHVAASQNAHDSIKFLLEHNFDWEAKDKHGWTAKDCIHVAEKAPARDASPNQIASLNLTWLTPIAWAFDTSDRGVFKMDGHAAQAALKTEYVQSGPESAPRICTLTADHYLLPTPTTSYFEVTIEECIPSNGVAVGIDRFIGEHKRTLGLGYCSWAYCGEDGNVADGTYEAEEYGPPFTEGDTIGCGIDYHAQQLFFTKNGKCLGIAGSDIQGRFAPAISTIEQKIKVDANFGQRPFDFDITKHGYGDKSCEMCYGKRRFHSEWRRRWVD